MKKRIRKAMFSAVCSILFVSAFIFNGSMLFGQIKMDAGQTSNIAFFEFYIHEKPDNNEFSIELNRMSLREGVLKNDISIAPPTPAGYLRCSFLTADDEVIKSINIEDPLHKRYEYAGEDHNTIYSTVLDLEETTFSIRTQYRDFIRQILVQKAVMNKDGIEYRNIDRFEVVPEQFNISKVPIFEMIKVVDNGPDNEKVNFVVMGDGYTNSELDDFTDDVNDIIVNYIFAQVEPYNDYFNCFNVYAIKIISNVSGASMDPNNLIDNYFGSTYWYGGIERLLVPTNNSRLSEVLQDHVPQYDQPLVIVNHDKYGGSGGWVATASINVESPDIMIHEVGHSFVGLIDEYWAGAAYAAEGINMTQDNNPATIRWKDHLNIEGVGIYSYAESPSWYRPHQNCKMRYLSGDFCRVCRFGTIEVIEDMCIITDIPEAENNHSWYVYPNPSDDIFTISFQGAYESVEIRIMNILGEEIMNEQYLHTQGGFNGRLDMGAYSPGVYYLSVRFNNYISDNKVIIRQ